MWLGQLCLTSSNCWPHTLPASGRLSLHRLYSTAGPTTNPGAHFWWQVFAWLWRPGPFLVCTGALLLLLLSLHGVMSSLLFWAPKLSLCSWINTRSSPSSPALSLTAAAVAPLLYSVSMTSALPSTSGLSTSSWTSLPSPNPRPITHWYFDWHPEPSQLLWLHSPHRTISCFLLWATEHDRFIAGSLIWVLSIDWKFFSLLVFFSIHAPHLCFQQLTDLLVCLAEDSP